LTLRDVLRETSRNLTIILGACFVLVLLAVANQDVWVYAFSITVGWSLADFLVEWAKPKPNFEKPFFILFIAVIIISAWLADQASKLLLNQFGYVAGVFYGATPPIFGRIFSISWLVLIVIGSFVVAVLTFWDWKGLLQPQQSDPATK
jgi:hypothetical protein